MAIKIAVANQKGGAGKTTTSLCLAQELKRRGEKVLFIDGDPQCNGTDFYEAEVEGQATLMDILCGDEPAKECIQQTEKGDIIASDDNLYDAETTVKADEMRFMHLKNSCKAIEKYYDYIIIDTPPAIGVVLKNILSYTDWIIIPVEESGWSMSGLARFAKAMNLARMNNKRLKVAGVLTVKTKKRTRKCQRMGALAEDIAKDLKTTRFETKIRESVACSEALTEYFVPLHEYAEDSTTNQDYMAFTDELQKVVNNG